MRSVLVIGGTGFLGRRISEEFMRHGDRVSVMTRGQTEVKGLPADIEYIHANRRDLHVLQSALEHRTFDAVVDNIAYEPDDVRTILQVLRSRIGHYLMTSSAAVYADRYGRRPIREHEADLTLRVPVEAPNPYHSRQGHAYANNKRAAEQAVTASDIHWTVLRAPVVLGGDDRTLRVWWFVQRLLDSEPILIPDWGPGRIFQVVWANDVARAFVAAATNPTAFGRTYNVAQSEVYTAESWIKACAAQLDVRATYAHISEDSLESAGLPGYLLPIAGRPFGHLLLDICAIRHDLGFEPSLESVWLAETVRGCAAQPPSANSPGYERRAEEVRVARLLLAQ